MLSLLQALLEDRPSGLSEYELLMMLAERGVPCFADGDRHDPLIMFRRHFLLFHLLYVLRDRLHAAGAGELAVHCLRIVLRPRAAAAGPDPDLPAEFDRLREYYLDFRHMEETRRQDVMQMLEGFWQMFARYDRRQEALDVLGLEAPVDRLLIKQRFRQLVRHHHPDHGGDPERFREIVTAADLLLGEGG